jgi:transposase
VQHFAIDFGLRESQICVASEAGEILRELRVATKSLKRLLKREPPSVVVLETCTGVFEIARSAEAMGHEVKLVPARLVRQLGVADRGIKTDRRDARALSLASARIELPGVHIPSIRARELKATSMLREGLVQSRTQQICQVRAYLRELGVGLPRGAARTFPSRVRAALLKRPEGLAQYVERVLAVLEALNEQIAESDAELKTLANADSVCTRLMSIPGMGPVTTIRLVGCVDDISRFDNAHQLESYLGLTPGENSSSGRVQRTGITKAGQGVVRRSLLQGAWAAIRCRPNDPMVQWAIAIAQRRNKQVAAVALARKMAGIAFALWRDGTTYDPRCGAQRSEAAEH